MTAPTEAAIQAAVIAHWRAFGLPDTRVAAIPNARAFGQAGLTKGLFDLVVTAPGLPVGFLELKTATGRVSKEQRDFLDHYHRLGIPAAITFGRDEPITFLEVWNVVRRQA